MIQFPEFVIYVSNIFLEKMCYHREPWSWEYDFLLVALFFFACFVRCFYIKLWVCGWHLCLLHDASVFLLPTYVLFFPVIFLLKFLLLVFFTGLCTFVVDLCKKKRYLWASLSRMALGQFTMDWLILFCSLSWSHGLDGH